MPTISLALHSGRYISFAEREEIAILHAQELGVRSIAANSDERHPRSLANCAEMLRHDPAVSIIVPPRHSGMQIGVQLTTGSFGARRFGLFSACGRITQSRSSR